MSCGASIGRAACGNERAGRRLWRHPARRFRMQLTVSPGRASCRATVRRPGLKSPACRAGRVRPGGPGTSPRCGWRIAASSRSGCHRPALPEGPCARCGRRNQARRWRPRWTSSSRNADARFSISEPTSVALSSIPTLAKTGARVKPWREEISRASYPHENQGHIARPSRDLSIFLQRMSWGAGGGGGRQRRRQRSSFDKNIAYRRRSYSNSIDE